MQRYSPSALVLDSPAQSIAVSSAHDVPVAVAIKKSPGRRSGTRFWWLAGAVVIFLLQVLPYLSYRWVTDESWYAGPAYSLSLGHGLRDPAIGPNDIENHVDARPPGTALVIATAFKVFGAGQIPARIGSVAAGLLVVLLTYGVSRRYLGEGAAVLAAFLVASDNLLVLSARTARPEAYTILCVLLMFAFVQKYADEAKTRSALLAGWMGSIGCMFHITLLGFLVSAFGILVWRDWSSRRFPKGAAAFAGGFLAGLLPYAIWVFTAERGVEGFRAEFLSRAITTPLWEKLLQEGRRYTDVLGLHLLHGNLAALPIRLPIPLLIVLAVLVLWKWRRSQFYLVMWLTIPTLLWFVYTVNKSSRYVTLLAPMAAFTLAAAVKAIRPHLPFRKFMLAGVACVMVAQCLANLYLLAQARKANYNALSSALHRVIPNGEPVYGTITYWLAFRDSPYISYERTWPMDAAMQFHVRYFIAGDRMMEIGDDRDRFYEDLNRQIAEVASKSDLMATIQDPYYGALRIYRIR